MGPLSKATRNVLAFIIRYSRDHGYPPTLRDICLHSGIGSGNTNAANYHVDQLIARGLVTKQPKLSRTLLVTAAGKAVLDTPEREGTPP